MCLNKISEQSIGQSPAAISSSTRSLSIKRCHELFLGHELSLLSVSLKLLCTLPFSDKQNKLPSLQVFKMPPYGSSYLFLKTVVPFHSGLFVFLLIFHLFGNVET